MKDYKRMYLTLMDAVEKATEILIKAQQRCEDIYVSELVVLSKEDLDDEIEQAEKN